MKNSAILKYIWLLVLYQTIFYGSISLAIAQELPPIDNFSPINYGAENQNWGISQSDQNLIYIANNGGLLEFNGASWQLYGSPNGSTIRSVKAAGDTIYTGCYMEFGFWKKNSLGILSYHSISNNLSFPLIEDEEFWNIVALDDWVLFQSLERIYIYNTADKSVKMVESKSTKAHMFNFQGTIFFHCTDKGLFKIENGKAVLVSDDSVLRDYMVLGIFRISEKPLLVTQKGDFYFLEDGKLVQWNATLSAELGEINIYSSLQLKDQSIILGTISNGIYQIDKDGVIIRKINQEKGLNNNTVLSLFEDVENNLWLALDNGISVVNIDSPFNEYIDKNGKLGVVYASAIFNDKLYLGTNQGLFCRAVSSDDDFKLVKGTGGQVWLLKEIDDVLFCGHNKGTYIIDKNEALLISDFPGTWDIKPVPNNKNLLLQGNFNGLSILSKKTGTWQFRNVIEGFDLSSRFFEYVGDNQVVVNRELKGVFTLNLDPDYTRVNKVSSEKSKGQGASLVNFLDNVLYTSNNGIMRYNRGQGNFSVDTALTNTFYGYSNDPVGIFISDKAAKRLWCFTDNSIAYASPGKFDLNTQISRIAIPSYVRKNLGVLGFESLTPLGDEEYLIGISNGYLKINLTKLQSKEYELAISTISRKSDNFEVERVPLDSAVTYEYKQNAIFFSYHVAEFDKYTEVNYQYQLKGMYDNWSDWASTTSASFENLPYGDYSFNVRAKVGNDLSMNTAAYKFRIERPWYLSNLAIFVYVLTGIMLALFVHKMYKSYYRRQREQLLKDSKKKLKRKRLKAQKKIVQIKNEKLQEEIESKNRELAISTMSIIKKNEFLNTIKDQLKDDVESPQVKAVIRTIDRNINSSDDWKFFENAFNNADKDFLKKIKNVHPELTSNDLRLCVYLRLNLSSKEIAPLLNISVKSVEVKRYRLRKKMKLVHESSLVSYILSI